MNERAKKILASGLTELGVRLTTADPGKFYLFADELRRWGSNINLTAIKRGPGIAVKHFLDSLTMIGIIGTKGPSDRIEIRLFYNF